MWNTKSKIWWRGPQSLTADDRKAIRDEVISQTQHVTDALTTEELQNEGARRSYTCDAVATVRHMINGSVGREREGVMALVAI